MWEIGTDVEGMFCLQLYISKENVYSEVITVRKAYSFSGMISGKAFL
jgi:hypothetical protein